MSNNFSSSRGTFNTHCTNHADPDYSGSYDEDNRRSRQPIKSISPLRARSSSSDSFVYDVGFKSVQNAQRRAARRDRDRSSHDPSGLPLDGQFGRFPVNSQSKKDFYRSSFRRISPATKRRKQVCYGCTPGYCICPTVSDDSE